MGITLTKVADSEDVWGRHRTVQYDLTPDTSYPGGGYAIAAADVGLNKIDGVHFEGGVSGRILPFWDNVNKKFMLLFPTGGATASPSTVTDPKVTTGADTASAVNAATPDLTPGQGKELLNTANASAFVFRARFIGY